MHFVKRLHPPKYTQVYILLQSKCERCSNRGSDQLPLQTAYPFFCWAIVVPVHLHAVSVTVGHICSQLSSKKLALASDLNKTMFRNLQMILYCRCKYNTAGNKTNNACDNDN